MESYEEWHLLSSLKHGSLNHNESNVNSWLVCEPKSKGVHSLYIYKTPTIKGFFYYVIKKWNIIVIF
jgi:hypothetical protein